MDEETQSNVSIFRRAAVREFSEPRYGEPCRMKPPYLDKAFWLVLTLFVAFIAVCAASLLDQPYLERSGDVPLNETEDTG